MTKTGMGRLEGRVAFVTGASSGIGAASALAFAREGARLVGFDLAEPGGAGDWEQACAEAPDSLFASGDVRDDAALGAAVDAARQRFGRIDVLLNSAGVAGGGPVHLVDPAEWDRVLDINLKGTFLASRRVLPVMLERASGSIIHVASVEGIEGIEGGSAYNASKGGVVLLTRNMAIDYARKGIRVNAICPGFIDTPLLAAMVSDPALAAQRDLIREAHQLGRFGRPAEVAAAAVFLASDESTFVTGHSLVVDGGYTAGHRFGLSRLLGLE